MKKVKEIFSLILLIVCLLTTIFWFLFSLWLFNWWLFYTLFGLCSLNPKLILMPLFYDYMDYWLMIYNNDYELTEAFNYFYKITNDYVIFSGFFWAAMLCGYHEKLHVEKKELKPTTAEWNKYLYSTAFQIMVVIFFILLIWALHHVLWYNVVHWSKFFKNYDPPIWLKFNIWFLTNSGMYYLYLKIIFYHCGDLVGFYLIIFYIKFIWPISKENYQSYVYLSSRFLEKYERLKTKFFKKLK